MSSVVIAGDTSGSISIAAPSVAGSNTLTLPASTGTVLTSVSPASDLPSSIKGPAFSAYGNVQSISNTTWTKIALQNEEFDTNNNFDSSTNYRFTPTVAGYYQINGGVYFGFTTGLAVLAIYKNGSEYKRGSANSAASGGIMTVVSSLVYFNGSTDYAEIYLYQNNGSSQSTNSGTALQYFNGAMIRSA